MIRRIETRTPEFDAVCDTDVFGTRTAGYFRTYGSDCPGVLFYAQYADAVCTGVLSAAFGNGSLTINDHADLAEWAEFIRFLGLDTLLCASAAAERMGLHADDKGFVMQYVSSDRKPKTQAITAFDKDFSYREVYDLLCACGFSPGAFEPWLGDIALRVRKSAANVLAVRDKTTVCTASVLFESDSAVYLGAVATHPSVRGRGLGGDLVLQLAQCGKRAEILCKLHRVSFYTSLGFSQIGEFSLCHFSK